MFVTAEFINNSTGEIKSQTVFMGDFPLMSPKGTFIINGTERVVVSQLVRSPGVYFDRQVDKTSDKDIYSCKVIPSRGAWLEFEIDKRDSVGVRIDRKRKQSVTVLLKALGWDEARIRERFGGFESMIGHPGEGPHDRPGRRAARHLPQAAARVSRRPGSPPRRCWRTSTSTASGTTWPRWAATRSTRSSASACRSGRAR
jgi:DNA-directed RNA polymerase beta subunit